MWRRDVTLVLVAIAVANGQVEVEAIVNGRLWGITTKVGGWTSVQARPESS